MKFKPIPLILFSFLLSFSGCFTPSLRTGDIATRGPEITASIGFQLIRWAKVDTIGVFHDIIWIHADIPS